MAAENAPITVLYVNDDPDLLELLTTGLEREEGRITVRTATSASEGLAIYRSEEIDCVVSDYHMPGGTGVELLRSIRADDADLPFIMFTETGSEEVASEAITADVSDYVIRETIESQDALLARKIVTAVERRRMADRAARADRRLHELAESSNDVLWMFAADWSELLFVNSAYEDIFGQPVERIRSDPNAFLDVVHADDLDRVELAMERAATGTPQQIEFRVEHPSAMELWVESHCHPITGEDGTVDRISGFTRDVTDRKSRERELATKNEQLDRFASTVAHDLRNPLTVANGYLDIAREECDNDHLETSAKALARMETLLADLLSLAQTGEAIGDLTTVEFADLMEASSANTAVPRSAIRITDSARVRCDPSRLKEAIENLLRNATEHNEESVTITAGILPVRNGIYVEDDGEGIPESEREQVFESGYTTLHDGTGFGLSIVEQIVDAHGWRIDVSAADCGGARFEISGMELDA